jgi:hypothetical protein
MSLCGLSQEERQMDKTSDNHDIVEFEVTLSLAFFDSGHASPGPIVKVNEEKILPGPSIKGRSSIDDNCACE